MEDYKMNQSDISRLDMKQINELKNEMGEHLSELIQMYIEESPVLLESIKKAVVESDKIKIRDTAHSLKSATNVFGTNLLSEQCKSLEEAAKADSELDYDKAFIEIDNEYQLFKKDLQELLM